jgi:hypothetical protein
MTRWLLTLGLAIGVASLAVPAAAQTSGPDEAAANPDNQTAATAAGGYVEPEPSVIPLSWQLNLKLQRVGRLVLKDTAGKNVYYWFVIYTVSNSSSKALDFMPRITMLTDALDIREAQLAISADLFKAIKVASNSKYLEEPLAVTRILGGEDNARDTVALFPLSGDPKWFRLFFAGFSGEQWPVKVPAGEPGKTRDVIMEKVRAMEFTVPGNTDAQHIPPITLKPGSDKWTMRALPPQINYIIDLSRAKLGKDPVYPEGGENQNTPPPDATLPTPRTQPGSEPGK